MKHRFQTIVYILTIARLSHKLYYYIPSIKRMREMGVKLGSHVVNDHMPST